MPENDILIKIDLLIEILGRKTGELQTILAICENQGLLLEQPPSKEITALFKVMTDEKQVHIDEVLKSDTVFQSIFDGIRDIMDAEKPAQRQKLYVLQQNIDDALKLDIAIRAQEAKNREAMKFRVSIPKQVQVTDATKRRAQSEYAIYGKKAEDATPHRRRTPQNT